MHSNGNVIIQCQSIILQRTIRHFLQDNAYNVICCNRPDDIRIALSIDDYLMLITDSGYPDETLDTALQRNPNLPVLHITGHWQLSGPSQHMHLAPPFNLSEITRLLHLQKQPLPPMTIPLGNFELIPAGNRIRYHNKETCLSKKEMDLLLLLCKNRPHVISKEAIGQKLWPESPLGKEKNIYVYINNLRNYLAADPSIRLISVYGKGFRLEEA